MLSNDINPVKNERAEKGSRVIVETKMNSPVQYTGATPDQVDENKLETLPDGYIGNTVTAWLDKVYSWNGEGNE